MNSKEHTLAELQQELAALEERFNHTSEALDTNRERADGLASALRASQAHVQRMLKLRTPDSRLAGLNTLCNTRHTDSLDFEGKVKECMRTLVDCAAEHLSPVDLFDFCLWVSKESSNWLSSATKQVHSDAFSLSVNDIHVRLAEVDPKFTMTSTYRAGTWTVKATFPESGTSIESEASTFAEAMRGLIIKATKTS